MKRLLCVICAALICVSAMAAADISAAVKSTYIRGDSDDNGKVEISDVTLAQQVLAGIEKDSGGLIAVRANVDGKGFNIDDATNVQRYLAQFDNIYSIGEKVTYPGYDEYELPFIPC